MTILMPVRKYKQRGPKSRAAWPSPVKLRDPYSQAKTCVIRLLADLLLTNTGAQGPQFG